MLPVRYRFDLLMSNAHLFAACVQNGTCIIAGGDEKLNAETAALAGKLIGCKPFDRTSLHLSVRGAAPSMPAGGLAIAGLHTWQHTLCSPA